MTERPWQLNTCLQRLLPVKVLNSNVFSEIGAHSIKPFKKLIPVSYIQSNALERFSFYKRIKPPKLLVRKVERFFLNSMQKSQLLGKIFFPLYYLSRNYICYLNYLLLRDQNSRYI